MILMKTEHYFLRGFLVVSLLFVLVKMEAQDFDNLKIGTQKDGSV
jgi:hypothetical protein